MPFMPKGWKGSLLHTGQNIVDKLDDQYDVAWNIRGKKEFNLFYVICLYPLLEAYCMQ